MVSVDSSADGGLIFTLQSGVNGTTEHIELGEGGALLINIRSTGSGQFVMEKQIIINSSISRLSDHH